MFHKLKCCYADSAEDIRVYEGTSVDDLTGQNSRLSARFPMLSPGDHCLRAAWHVYVRSVCLL
jgi:hypothetical protein